jgi:nucleoside permease NupC
MLFTMQDDAVVEERLSPADAEQLMHRVMWRQARLSLTVAAVFIAILVILPLFNLLMPDIASVQVAGFSATWLLLGVLFYPITWLLSAVFVKKSDLLESAISKEEKRS